MKVKYLWDYDEKLKNWGEGPWLNEPDEVDFDYLEYKCKVVRTVNEVSPRVLWGGQLRGCVLIPFFHNWYNCTHETFPIETHAPISFVEIDSFGKWFGFDCAGVNDLVPSFNKMNQEFQLNFHSSYKNIEFVKLECMRIVDKAHYEALSLAERSL